MDNKEQKNSIQIELKDDVADGIYSNMVLIAHSRTEFVLDFISLLPGVPKAQVKSRVIITPEHAKRFLFALGDNIRKYEDQNGEIILENPDSLISPFNGNIGEA